MEPAKEENSDMLYFKTLLVYVDQISPERKLLFREELLNLVRRYTYPQKSGRKRQVDEDNITVVDWRTVRIKPMYQQPWMKQEPVYTSQQQYCKTEYPCMARCSHEKEIKPPLTNIHQTAVPSFQKDVRANLVVATNSALRNVKPFTVKEENETSRIKIGSGNPCGSHTDEVILLSD